MTPMEGLLVSGGVVCGKAPGDEGTMVPDGMRDSEECLRCATISPGDWIAN